MPNGKSTRADSEENSALGTALMEGIMEASWRHLGGRAVTINTWQS